MDDHGHIGFEQQQPAVAGLGAVDGEVVQADALVEGLERRAVAHREILIEIGHEPGLFLAALGVLGHAGAKVMHHPVL